MATAAPGMEAAASSSLMNLSIAAASTWVGMPSAAADPDGITITPAASTTTLDNRQLSRRALGRRSTDDRSCLCRADRVRSLPVMDYPLHGQCNCPDCDECRVVVASCQTAGSGTTSVGLHLICRPGTSARIRWTGETLRPYGNELCAVET